MGTKKDIAYFNPMDYDRLIEVLVNNGIKKADATAVIDKMVAIELTYLALSEGPKIGQIITDLAFEQMKELVFNWDTKMQNELKKVEDFIADGQSVLSNSDQNAFLVKGEFTDKVVLSDMYIGSLNAYCSKRGLDFYFKKTLRGVEKVAR